MRSSLTNRALAATALAGGLVLGGTAVAPAHAAPAVVTASGANVDEPLEQDRDDDTGKYGLIGLTGLLGLFGYKKYRDSHPRSGQRIGGVDTDGSGSRRT